MLDSPSFQYRAFKAVRKPFPSALGDELEEKEARSSGQIILLGSGNSGKTTLFKQFVYCASVDSYAEELVKKKKTTKPARNSSLASKSSLGYVPKPLLLEVASVKVIIYKVLVLGFIKLAQAARNHATELCFSPEATEALKVAREAVEQLKSSEDGFTLTSSFVTALLDFWNDETVQQIYESKLKHRSWVLETPAILHFDYFMANLVDFPVWGGAEWCPSYQDVVRASNRTTGFQKHELMFMKKRVAIIDTGGQRSERRKWPELFSKEDDPWHSIPRTSLVFVVPVSEYDSTCFEDSHLNQLLDSLTLFKQLNASLFKQHQDRICHLSLVFNKADLFKRKLATEKVPFNISGNFPDAPVSFDYGTTMKWVMKQFRQHNVLKGKTSVFLCNALETMNVHKILKKNLHKVTQVREQALKLDLELS